MPGSVQRFCVGEVGVRKTTGNAVDPIRWVGR